MAKASVVWYGQSAHLPDEPQKVSCHPPCLTPVVRFLSVPSHKSLFDKDGGLQKAISCHLGDDTFNRRCTFLELLLRQAGLSAHGGVLSGGPPRRENP